MPGGGRATAGIGIGIPVHQAEAHLEPALESLFAQTHVEFRAIALDDGSTDRSGEILRSLAARDPRLEVVTEPRRTGLVRAWRRVAELVRDRHRPEFFAWYADHDLVSPDWLESLLRALREDPTLVCAYAPARRIALSGEPLEHEPLTFDSSSMGPWERIEASAGLASGGLGAMPIGAGDVVYGLFRLAALERCGIFRDELLPDRLLVAEVQLHGGIRCVPRATRWRRTGAGTPTLEETLARQLPRLFPEGEAPESPVVSHLTALLRRSLEPLPDETPEERFRRSLQAWLYLLRQFPRFRAAAIGELRGRSGPGKDPIRGYIAHREAGLPFVDRTRLEASEHREAERSEEVGRLRAALDARTEELRSRSATTAHLRERLERVERELRWARWLGVLPTIAARARRLRRAYSGRRSARTELRRRRILHIVPTSVEDPALRYHGTTKDIGCRTEYFAEREIEVRRIVTRRDENAILEALHGTAPREFGAVLLDIPGHSHPEVLRHLRRAAPEAILVVRSFNAELPHRLDWMRAARDPREKVRYLLRGISMGARDIETSFLADRIIAISDHDARGYWERFAPRGKVSCVPYFIPAEYRSPPRPGTAKELRCVCLGSTARTPMIDEASQAFLELVASIGDAAPGWSFSLTGETDPAWRIPPRVEPMGLLDTPFRELGRCRAMALLSPHGRGFKTKILDAHSAGVFVLIHPQLHRRLPEEVLPVCLPVDPREPREFLAALERCRGPYPESPVNERLRARAFRALDEALGLAVGDPAQRRG